jgi:hypothetical protein
LHANEVLAAVDDVGDRVHVEDEVAGEPSPCPRYSRRGANNVCVT